MSDTINQKKLELRAAIETEIKSKIMELMEGNFPQFCDSLCNNTRDDQLTRIIGADVVSLVKEFRKLS